MRPTMRCTLVLFLFSTSLINCDCNPSPPIEDAAPPDSSNRDSAFQDHGYIDRADFDTTGWDHEQQPADAAMFDGPQPDTHGADGPGLDSSQTEAGSTQDSASTEAGLDGGFLDASLGDLTSMDLNVQDQGPFAEVPATPQNPRAFFGARVRLRCDPSERAQNYRAYQAYSESGPFIAVGQASPIPELMISGLDYDLVQYFVIRAENNVGLSAASEVVHARALDGISTKRSQLSGFITQNNTTIENARVRLYSAVDHGVLLAEARSDAQGHYQMLAPSGIYRGLIAGFDELPQDGNAFEVGYDSVGYLLFDDAVQPGFIHLLPGEVRNDLNIELKFKLLSASASGQVQVGDGWPLAELVIEAYNEDSPLRAFRVHADNSGLFDLACENNVYQLRAFLDVDGDGEQGVNEPASSNIEIDLGNGDLTDLSLSIPATATISGRFNDSDSAATNDWSIMAKDTQSGEIFQRSLGANSDYSLTVSAGRSYRVTAFIDQDLNGQRSYYDLNRNALRDSEQERWSESAMPSQDDVTAGQQDLTFNLGERIHIGGLISPAMQPWLVCAQTTDQEWMFCDASQPDGHFDIAVQSTPSPYLVYAYRDVDGNSRPTPGLEAFIFSGDLVDSTLGNKLDLNIVERRISGQVSSLRENSEHPQATEMIVVQQFVHGQAAALLCSDTFVINNYARVDAQGVFQTHTGAIGDGGGTRPLSTCAGECSGLIVHRAWNLQGNFAYREQDCNALQVLTYPQNPETPENPILLLDSSAGDLNSIAL